MTDGQTPKRRGPKPDSKPALTRRQELNRQAQRTHRERKENYIKSLEQEVLQLKETLTVTTHEKTNALQENRRLKELLRQHGIPYGASTADYGYNVGGSHGDSLSTRGGGGGAATSTNVVAAPYGQPSTGPSQGDLDLDQIGIDFVLTLERPCMEHMQTLMVQAQESEGDISGHALLANAPPHSFLLENSSIPYDYDAVDLRRPELKTLMNLSRRLQLDGEITPVMAWSAILTHERLHELTARDFATVKAELKAKVRCHGFGAVVEEFELRDALSSVFATKLESYNVFS
ncbi:MAG: hypothetical protein M1838_003699 [Thelocarpon superellum]|nr:MAG: hypothetical protein M1838_003699 [Thelocarpon superellum]